MSILKPEFLSAVPAGGIDVPSAAPADFAQTSLIAKLANELFNSSAAAPALSGASAQPHASASAPAEAAKGGVPSWGSVSAPAASGYGLPAEAASLPASSTGLTLPASVGSPQQAAKPDNGSVALAGGFPATTSSAGVPPVHPSVVDAEPDAAAPQDSAKVRAGESVPSGTQRLHEHDGHEFGEPYFYSGKRHADKSGGTKQGSAKQNGAGGAPSLKAAQHSPAGYNLTDSAAGLAEVPDFYFLPKAQAPVAAPYGLGAKPAVTTTPWAAALSEAPSTGFDIQAVRRDFPALHQQVNGKPLIWLDNAATTHKPQAVIDATSSFYARDNSNIHRAAHTLAARSTDLFEAGREKVRRFLGAGDAKEIVFVRGTTEAINLVAQSYGRSHIGAGDEILLSALEHHANIVPWQILASQVGAVLKVIPINDRGELIVEKIPELITSRTKIVSIAHVSNSLGTVNPVQEIIALAHSRGVPVLVDGAQSTPHIPINVQALDADFFVFSGHKIFGPTGIGALYAKRHWLETLPAWQGGGHMIKDVTFEKTVFNGAPEKFEAGTPDIAGVVGLGAAIDYLFSVGIPAIAAYEHSLLEYATEALATVPGLRAIGTAANKASVLSFVLPGFDNLAVARYLDEQGIAVRAGHHCAQPAIRHFGLETSVRPSLAFYNTFAEVDSLVSALWRLTRR